MKSLTNFSFMIIFQHDITPLNGAVNQEKNANISIPLKSIIKTYILKEDGDATLW